ncbi:MAG: RIP metalloprotease RseP [Chloroflexi bacterium]|nr:RIP metalloprotease RseP [Chloroflexota bacterium]
MLVSIVSFLIILLVIVLAHELGHFITAKASGVKVEEFGIGFPPRIFGIKRGETMYSLNAIPLGGFTKMAGEEDPGVARSLASKSKGIRFMVLVAGSAMNLLLPLVLFSISFMLPHDTVTEPVVVKDVAADSPAASAGIRPGDTIISINGQTIDNVNDLHRYIQMNLGNEVSMLVKRSDSTTDKIDVLTRWKPPPGQGATGIQIDIQSAIAGQKVVTRSEPFWRAIPQGAIAGIDTFVLFKNEIIRMFIGTASVQLTGPIGIAQLTGEMAKAGISPLLEFAAFLSINLGIINLFPIPALDGGRIAFVLLEWVRRGKRIPPKVEGMMHLIGFALLIAAMLAITYRDILRIVGGESLLP